MDEDTFTLTLEVTEYVDPFASLTVEAQEPTTEADEPEVIEPELTAEAFTFPPIEFFPEEDQEARLPGWVLRQWGDEIPEWLDAYLDGRKIAITPGDDAGTLALFEMVEDIADQSLNLHGITMQDVFEWQGW